MSHRGRVVYETVIAAFLTLGREFGDAAKKRGGMMRSPRERSTRVTVT
jgi:hypothetical protein